MQKKIQILELFNFLRENQNGNSLDFCRYTNKGIFFTDKEAKKKVKTLFSRWKSSNLITFDSNNGIYYNIKFTKKGLETPSIKKILNIEYLNEAEKEVQTYKINEYINQVEKTRDIINSSTLRHIDRLKAIDLQQKALAQIKGNYAYDCLKNILN